MNKYKNYKISIIKRLGIIDKEGEWVQVEILEGKDKGKRMPITLEELKNK